MLVELDALEEVLTLREALAPRRAEPGDVLDLVPGATTLLVVVGHPAQLPAVRAAVRSLLAAGAQRRPRPEPDGPAPLVAVEVHYDGPDLAAVAAHTALTEAEVVAAHTGTPWTVGFAGFAPGFAYLAGGDPRLIVPRRARPRTVVPAGAVGLAGPFSGIYPRSSPGGWQLLGHTDAVLWDLRRDPPALLRPGARVRFVDCGAAHGRR